MHTVAHQPYVLYYCNDQAEPSKNHPGLDDGDFAAEALTPAAVLGFLQPRPYAAGDWTWIFAGSYQQAIVSALNPYRTAINKRPLHISAWQDLSDATLLKIPTLSNKAPAYHPTERTTEHTTSRTNPYEVKIATALLAVGHSLVVVEPSEMSHDISKYTNTTEVDLGNVPYAPAMVTRWGIGVGDQAEFLPPLYLGFFLGRWYALRPRHSAFFQRYAPQT